ncbi:MAG TPA: phospholipase D-like domain-containing protein [Mariprofundaceae bacterium]|nr:phospholipase D-like domain-containing protein [Mariprofundaceae bacterium]
MAVKVGNIEFYSGPDAVGAPDNLEKTIIDFINGAKKSLEIAVQELENKEIAKAIISARQRKVTVKLVLEQDYLRASRASRDPWEYKGVNEENRQIHDAILRANIDVKSDYNPSIFHQKFIVRDRESVLTGSTNFTPTGTSQNLNHVVIIHDKGIARIYYREFREIQQGHFGRLNEGNDKAPREILVSNVRVKVLFAPDHNPEMEIMKQMMKAKSRVDFAMFTFSKSSGIDDTMFKLLELNIPIQGALDIKQGGQDWAATKPLAQKGAALSFVPKRGDSVRKLHHKLMVLDDQVIIAGSFNYTGPANNLNDENIIILGDLDTTSPAQKQAQSKLAKFARLEIDRINKDHGRAVI